MEQRNSTRERLAGELIAACGLFHQRGWVPATGGNFSARLPDGDVLITASGVHKGELVPEDFIAIDTDGRAREPGRKTSYETGLHTQLYRYDPAIQSVLHVHSVANTVLSRRRRQIVLQGYELQKILPEIKEPAEQPLVIPVFGNDQDIARLSHEVDRYMREQNGVCGYLIAGHGLYTWGASVAQARHRVEALEFMFECEIWSERSGP